MVTGQWRNLSTVLYYYIKNYENNTVPSLIILAPPPSLIFIFAKNPYCLLLWVMNCRNVWGVSPSVPSFQLLSHSTEHFVECFIGEEFRDLLFFMRKENVVVDRRIDTCCSYDESGVNSIEPEQKVDYFWRVKMFSECTKTAICLNLWRNFIFM